MIDSSSRRWSIHGTWQICTGFFTSLREELSLTVSSSQVLIDISPSYFRYMDSTSNRASVLAKLMGFYTIETSNLASGDREVINLLVMENVFCDRRVVKSFDLKGIQGRKVKANDKPGTDGTRNRTLFDL